MCEEMRDAWRRVKDDPAVNAVVLRAAGDRAFCAGLDTQEALRPARRRLEPRGPRRAAQPEVAEGVEAGGLRGARHLHRRRLLLPQRGRHRHLLDGRHVLRLARHLRDGLGARAGRADAAGSASARRCASRLSGNDERVTAATALRIGLVTEVVDRADAVGPGPRDRRRHRRASRRAATQGTVRAIWESLDRPVPRRDGAGPDLHPARQPDRHGRGRRAAAADRPEPTAPLMADDAAALGDRIARGARRSTRRRRRSSSSGRWHTWGELGRHGRRGRRRSCDAGRARSACCCATGRRTVGLLLGVLRAGGVRGHGQPRARARARPRRPRVARPAGPSPASPPTSTDLVARRRSAPARARARRARRAARRRPATRTGAGDASAARASRCGCSRAARPGRRSGSTSPTRRSSGCSSGPSTTSATRDAELRLRDRRADRELAAGPPRRAVPRPAVRQRRPVVLRCSSGSRVDELGRRRAPPPPAHREPGARGAAHGARSRPRSRRPRQRAVGRLGHRAARPRRRRRLHRAVRRARADRPTPPPSSAAASPAGTSPTTSSSGRPSAAASGRAHPGCELRVVDPDDRRAARPDEEGLLEVQGRASSATTPAGSRTTDLARIDADGFLWILGRADQAIIRGGFKVRPDDVRAALERHPRVRGAAVVEPAPTPGSARCRWPRSSCARAPTVSRRRPARARRRACWPATSCPTEIRIVDELPRTPSGKVDLAAVRALFAWSRGWTRDLADALDVRRRAAAADVEPSRRCCGASPALVQCARGRRPGGRAADRRPRAPPRRALGASVPPPTRARASAPTRPAERPAVRRPRARRRRVQPVLPRVRDHRRRRPRAPGR